LLAPAPSAPYDIFIAALVAAPVTGRSGWYLGQILADRARRHAQAGFQQQFLCNALFTPRGILIRHPADQRLELQRNWRSASLALSTPVKPEALAVKTDKGSGVTTVNALRQSTGRLSHSRVKRVGWEMVHVSEESRGGIIACDFCVVASATFRTL